MGVRVRRAPAQGAGWGTCEGAVAAPATPGARKRALPMVLAMGALAVLGVLALARGAAAQPIDLWVQPGLGAVSEPGNAARLATYLSDASGLAVRERTSANVLAHWRAVRDADGPVLVLDEAHFVDARVQTGRHVPFARIAGLVGHSIVSAPGTLLLDIDELEGRTLAAPPAPALATVRVIALFPDPVRRPRLRDARDLGAALALLRAGRVDAALVPTAMLPRLSELNAVLDAEAAPAPGLTASSDIAARARATMREALLGASSRPRGRALLDALGVAGFEPADAETYEGFAVLLRGTWRDDPAAGSRPAPATDQ